MRIQYLLDENLDPRFVRTMQRHYPAVDVLRVGGEGAPSLGVSDPDILRFVESHHRILVTDNRKSMPGHVLTHNQAGGHHWGIFIIDKSIGYKQLADALFVYWEASQLEDWTDQTEWNTI